MNKGAKFSERLMFAVNGLVAAFKREKSLQFEAFAFICVIVYCIVDDVPAIWTAHFIQISIIVLVLELTNTALEVMMDKVHPAWAKEIGFAKDCLAGAVLVASFGAVALMVFYLAVVR